MKMIAENKDYAKIHTLAEQYFGVSLTQVQMEYLLDVYPELGVELYLDDDKYEFEELLGHIINQEVMDDMCDWPLYDDDKECKDAFYEGFTAGAKARGYKLTGWWENPFPKRAE